MRSCDKKIEGREEDYSFRLRSPSPSGPRTQCEKVATSEDSRITCTKFRTTVSKKPSQSSLLESRVRLHDCMNAWMYEYGYVREVSQVSVLVMLVTHVTQVVDSYNPIFVVIQSCNRLSRVDAKDFNASRLACQTLSYGQEYVSSRTARSMFVLHFKIIRILTFAQTYIHTKHI